MPWPRSASATPVGPKKPLAVVSAQAKPTTLPARVAIQVMIGCAANATSHSLAQVDWNVRSIQPITTRRSGASARRTVTSGGRRCTSPPSGKS